jgi:hypothetical protein
MAPRKTFLPRNRASAGTAHRDGNEHSRGHSHDARIESPAKSRGISRKGKSIVAEVG